MVKKAILCTQFVVFTGLGRLTSILLEDIRSKTLRNIQAIESVVLLARNIIYCIIFGDCFCQAINVETRIVINFKS
jgi:hypothetical protein